MKVEHYLPLLLKRPGAFPYAKPVRHWEMPAVYQEFLNALKNSLNGGSPREFILALSLGRTYGQEQLKAAMRQALDERRPGYDRVRQLLMENSSTAEDKGLQHSLEEVKVVLPDASQFDRLWHTPGDGERAAG